MRNDPLGELVESGQIAPDWAEALAAVDRDQTLPATLSGLAAFLADERAGGTPVLPEPDQVFRAFERPLASVRVLIVGQDPYPTPGHPIGLSFATAAHVRPLPRSLRNIYRELADDLGEAADGFSVTGRWDPDDFWAPPEPHGDLSGWADAGVLLLNRVLTVRAGEAGSHRGRGWEAFTELAIRALAARGGPLVAILWGNDARQLGPLLGGAPRIESAHPSPLSASRGFFGSRPFSRANAELEAQGAAPIDWCAGRV